VLAPDQEAAAARLRLLGVAVERFAQGTTVGAERFHVLRTDTGVRADGRGAIDGGDGVLRFDLELAPTQAAVPAGAFYVSLAQPLGNIAAAALEPDSQNSFAANRLMPLGGDALLRVMSPPDAPLRMWDDR